MSSWALRHKLSATLTPYCYYTCNLAPLGLIARCGWKPRWLGLELEGPPAGVSLSLAPETLFVHPMTCPYVTQLLGQAGRLLGQPDIHHGEAAASLSTAAALAAPRIVVPGGCDAMRRLGDQLAFLYPERVFVMHVPRSSEPEAITLLARELARLETWLFGPETKPGADSETNSNQDIIGDPPAVKYPATPKPRGVFVIAGPLSDASLLELILHLGADVAGLESCTSPDRWQPLLEAGSTLPEAGCSLPTDDSGHRELAAKLLQIGMCPRRSTSDRRAYLRQRLEETQASSVIYARQSFCDPGAYDALGVAELCREMGLPYLELEVDFPFDPTGPLRTRIEAFLEAQLLDESLLDDDLFADVDV
ncbi:MAG: 2-hydroxyacyl-CoA dehydratase family protein [Thermoleophilia bacterium]|nr:2-hydroxyacyl-CoA dehydratase family protein [Thermoleophilia bacterium]